MARKRKLSYEQAVALERGHKIALANQRRRVAARLEREAQERAATEAAKREADKPVKCPECEGTRRHDKFCSRPVELA